ncbi:MAG TPA: protein kinase [Kofleriaceae bacterium]|jgi:serine/threonine-protein kinase
MFGAGDLIAGKFQIERVIGRGGMGCVVAAMHVHLGQRVALKFLLPEMAVDRGVVERFLREARASAQLRSEHVCRVSDVGLLDDGSPYFVMELLEGRDLASLLAERGPFPVPTIVDYVVQACLGLAEAHAAQIVHRDLKPANLFLTSRPDGTPLIKIVDFGIAKASATASFHLTRTDAVMGSPGYMSPEQLRSSRTADARSDIWALGVILFELASGHQPFTAESITDLALRIAMDPTPQLHSIPPGFDRVVYRCLEKDPARRYQDIGQLAMALAPFGGPAMRERALGVTRVLLAVSGAAGSTAIAAAAAAPTTLGSSASSLERGGRDRLRGIVIGGLAAGVLGTVAFVKLRGGDARVAPADPSSPPAATAAAAAPDTSAPPDAPPPGAVAGNAASGNAAIGNPATGNPATGNPAIGNPAIGNPATGNPATGNAVVPGGTPGRPADAVARNAVGNAASSNAVVVGGAPGRPVATASPGANAPPEASPRDVTAVDARRSHDGGGGNAARQVDAPPPADATTRDASAPPDATTRDAGAGDAARPTDAAVPLDAARPDAAAPVRKVTRPHPAPRAGSDDDVENSRL